MIHPDFLTFSIAFFATVDENYANNIPKCKTHFTEFVKDINHKNPIFVAPITASEIDDKILLLANKSYSLYSCQIYSAACGKYTKSPSHRDSGFVRD